MVTQQQRSDSTRAALLDAFRISLLDQGVEATTIAKVLADTGLSKGALYHHFRSKTEIIEALYEAESRAAIDRAAASVDSQAPPLIRLREACIAWLSEAQDEEVAAILFVIGPEALGMMRAKQIEDRYSLSLFGSLLREAEDRGEIRMSDPALTARLLNALMAEAALVARSEGTLDPQVMSRVIDGVIAALALRE